MTKDNKEDHWAIWLLALLLSVPSAILAGVVLSDLWEWFIHPLGVPAIGIAHAMGIAVIVAGFKASLAQRHKNKPLTMLISHVLGVLFVWAYGAIVHACM